MTHSPQHIRLSADGLTDGAKRACLRMTDEWQFPGKATFDANGAWALCRAQSGFFALAERELQEDGKWTRRAYRLTTLGLAVRAHLQEQAMKSAVEDALRKGSGFTFPPGTAVRKAKGYLWPGVVVAAFRTLAGQERYVVECTAEAVAGALHIYNPDQLEVADA